MEKFRLLLFVFILSLTACQQQMESLSDEAVGELTSAKDRLWMIKEIHQGVETKAVAEKSKTWQSGDIIRIKFLNGTEAVQNKVKQYASLWLEYADLVFEYVENDADVKISFDWDGKLVSWSTIGTDCRLVPQNESSLNFVYLDDPDEEFVRGEVLRAFGHVLGLGFEHKNPSSPLVFKATAAATLQDYYGLTPEEVTDFIAQYQADQTNYSAYDKNSIMVAEIPGSILENRRLATLFNTELSANDIAFISDLYAPVEPQKTLEFEMLVENVYATEDVFFIDNLGENIYYLLPESFPVNYETAQPRVVKMNLATGVKTTLFQVSGIVRGLVVDQQENFYVSIWNTPMQGIWKYNKNGALLQQMQTSSEHMPLSGEDIIAMDVNDYLYVLSNRFEAASPQNIITYIYRFHSNGYSCIQQIKSVSPNFWISNVAMMNSCMMFRVDHTNKTDFYQMDIPTGNTLVKNNLNIDADYDDFAFITNYNSDQVYLLIRGRKSSIYKYDLSKGDAHYIGDLPSELVKSDGTILKYLQLCGGKILSDNELILLGTVGEKNNTCIVKVNIITANR